MSCAGAWRRAAGACERLAGLLYKAPFGGAASAARSPARRQFGRIWAFKARSCGLLVRLQARPQVPFELEFDRSLLSKTGSWYIA